MLDAVAYLSVCALFALLSIHCLVGFTGLL